LGRNLHLEEKKKAFLEINLKKEMILVSPKNQVTKVNQTNSLLLINFKKANLAQRNLIKSQVPNLTNHLIKMEKEVDLDPRTLMKDLFTKEEEEIKNRFLLRENQRNLMVEQTLPDLEEKESK